MLLSGGFPHLVAFLPPTESIQPVKEQSVAGTGVDLRLPHVLEVSSGGCTAPDCRHEVSSVGCTPSDRRFKVSSGGCTPPDCRLEVFSGGGTPPDVTRVFWRLHYLIFILIPMPIQLGVC
jgi:hypothetical protein